MLKTTDTFADQLDDAISALMDDYMEDMLEALNKPYHVFDAPGVSLYGMNWYNYHSNK